MTCASVVSRVVTLGSVCPAMMIRYQLMVSIIEQNDSVSREVEAD